MNKVETRGRKRIYGQELTSPAGTALPPSLRQALEVQAAKDGKTLSSIIAYSCERFVGARKMQEGI